jgi:hypothetical protein
MGKHQRLGRGDIYCKVESCTDYVGAGRRMVGGEGCPDFLGDHADGMEKRSLGRQCR